VAAHRRPTYPLESQSSAIKPTKKTNCPFLFQGWEICLGRQCVTESLSQSEFACARCYDVLHVCVPFDASVDVTDARRAMHLGRTNVIESVLAKARLREMGRGCGVVFRRDKMRPWL
jgi:hypothetical protein